MNAPFAWAIALPAAYLIGSMPSGLLIARLRGVDLKKQGSGSTGATNVLRTVGVTAGVAVLALDALKGAAAIMLARLIAGSEAPVLSAFTGVTVVAGHSWSLIVFSLARTPSATATRHGIVGRTLSLIKRLESGKGVATGAGVLTVVSPLAAAMTLVGLAAILATKYVSLGSIIGTATGVVAVVVLVSVGRVDAAYLVYAFGGAAIIEFRHISNMRRILNGTESRLKFSQRRRSAPDAPEA